MKKNTKTEIEKLLFLNESMNRKVKEEDTKKLIVNTMHKLNKKQHENL